MSSYMMARLSGCSLLLCLDAIECTRDRSRSTSGSFFIRAREASASGERSPASSETASKRALICLITSGKTQVKLAFKCCYLSINWPGA